MCFSRILILLHTHNLTLLGTFLGYGVILFIVFVEIYSIERVNMFGLGSVDLVSSLLILITVFIRILMLVSRVRTNLCFQKEYKMLIVLLAVSLFYSFRLFDLIGFYLFFEAVLIPISILVFKWGNQPERLQAGKYILLYTLFGSLPLLIVLLWLNLTRSVCWVYLGFTRPTLGTPFTFFLFLAFLVKIPIYSVHLWLPKAHVEAPVAGSMILAGVLLKLGGYGIIRIRLFIKVNNIFIFDSFIIAVSLVGSLFVSFICLRQVDVKSLIAYSSVCHIGFVIGGLLSNTIWGTIGALVLMLGHGLCSSGLFCVSNIVYERLYTRNIIIIKGMILVFPSMALWWFLLSVINIGAPPFMNMFGEILLMASILKWDFFSFVCLIFLSFLSAAYSLYLFRVTQHGKSWGFQSVEISDIREFILIYSHVIPLGLYILKIEIVSFRA